MTDKKPIGKIRLFPLLIIIIFSIGWIFKSIKYQSMVKEDINLMYNFVAASLILLALKYNNLLTKLRIMEAKQ